MSNLTNNTASLQAILNTINELPQAGQGGTNTSDATVTAGDLAEGVIAYGAVGQVVGSVKTSDGLHYSGMTPTLNSSQDELMLSYTLPEKTFFSENSDIDFSCSLSKLGDATASDVVAGKTFTSSDGLKVTGTLSYNSSGSLVQAKAAPLVLGTFKSGEDLVVNYGQNARISDGAITYLGSGTVAFSSTSHTDRISIFWDKYVNIGDNYYYIPTNATCTITGTSTYTVTCSEANQLFILA